jgi:acid stress-induced BolA-like protein IbaG/YrbA
LTPAEITQLIKQGLPDAEVRVSSDDGTHFEAEVVTSNFVGKPALARHRMVYAFLGERMGRDIHALSLRTLTPDEWRQQSGG